MFSNDLSDKLRRTLTSLAEELYWGEADYCDAVEQVRQQAEESGFEFIDKSENRLVIKISQDQLSGYDEPLAAKLPRRRTSCPGGIKQNVTEIDLYRNSPDWLREFLIPIEAAHSKGFWLVMRYAPQPDDESEIETRKRQLLEKGIRTNEILPPQNWGRWQEEVYITDYGLGVADCVDVGIRDWVDIVDEEDSRRGLLVDEATEVTNEQEDENDDSPDIPVAQRVVANADILPSMKQNVRQELAEEKVRTGDEIFVDINNQETAVEIHQTEPRTDRPQQDKELLISDETRITLENDIE